MRTSGVGLGVAMYTVDVLENMELHLNDSELYCSLIGELSTEYIKCVEKHCSFDNGSPLFIYLLSFI